MSGRINAPLVFVNGVALPQPSVYPSKHATIVDAARNAKGVMIGATIRGNVAKVELNWNYLTRDEWAAVCGHFIGAHVNTVRYFDTSVAAFMTRRMYVSDRDAQVHLLDRNTGLPVGYTNCRIALIEV